MKPVPMFTKELVDWLEEETRLDVHLGTEERRVWWQVGRRELFRAVEAIYQRQQDGEII